MSAYLDSAVVLLSAGLDSTVNLFAVAQKMKILKVLTFNYGQKAARQEIRKSQELCARLSLVHVVIELPWMREFTSSSLLNPEKQIPTTSVQIDNFQESLKTAKSVWVPNRNGVFLNIAAAWAESLGASVVVPGFNKEEATTFPDNSKAYLQSLDQTFQFSTVNHVRVHCETIDMDKTEIVKRGMDLKVPFQMIWPCYLDQEKWCGKCESCQRSLRAFKSHQLDVQSWGVL